MRFLSSGSRYAKEPEPDDVEVRMDIDLCERNEYREHSLILSRYARALREVRQFLASQPCPVRSCSGFGWKNQTTGERVNVGRETGHSYGDGRNPGIETHYHGPCKGCGGEGSYLAFYNLERERKGRVWA